MNDERIIEHLVKKLNALERKNQYTYATWVAAESVDADLSIIDTGDVSEITGTSEVRFVPRGAHVSGLTAGATILCTKNPWVIVAVVKGDITLAEI